MSMSFGFQVRDLTKSLGVDFSFVYHPFLMTLKNHFIYSMGDCSCIYITSEAVCLETLNLFHLFGVLSLVQGVTMFTDLNEFKNWLKTNYNVSEFSDKSMIDYYVSLCKELSVSYTLDTFKEWDNLSSAGMQCGQRTKIALRQLTLLNDKYTVFEALDMDNNTRYSFETKEDVFLMLLAHCKNSDFYNLVRSRFFSESCGVTSELLKLKG